MVEYWPIQGTLLAVYSTHFCFGGASVLTVMHCVCLPFVVCLFTFFCVTRHMFTVQVIYCAFEEIFCPMLASLCVHIALFMCRQKIGLFTLCNQQSVCMLSFYLPPGWSVVCLCHIFCSGWRTRKTQSPLPWSPLNVRGWQRSGLPFWTKLTEPPNCLIFPPAWQRCHYSRCHKEI